MCQWANLQHKGKRNNIFNLESERVIFQDSNDIH